MDSFTVHSKTLETLPAMRVGAWTVAGFRRFKDSR